MALTFYKIIAGAPPTGGDTGEEFAQKINDNFEAVDYALESFVGRETVFYENGSIEETLDDGKVKTFEEQQVWLAEEIKDETKN